VSKDSLGKIELLEVVDRLFLCLSRQFAKYTLAFAQREIRAEFEINCFNAYDQMPHSPCEFHFKK
jgi:hypothetical protein